MIRKLIISLTICAIFIPAASQAARFQLFYSSDVRGETEPCG